MRGPDVVSVVSVVSVSKAVAVLRVSGFLIAVESGGQISQFRKNYSALSARLWKSFESHSQIGPANFATTTNQAPVILGRHTLHSDRQPSRSAAACVIGENCNELIESLTILRHQLQHSGSSSLHPAFNEQAPGVTESESDPARPDLRQHHRNRRARAFPSAPDLARKSKTRNN